MLFLFFSYSIFIEIWKKQEKQYFNNFIEQYESSDARAAYKGPYVRNLVDDNANHFKTPDDFWQTLRKLPNHGLIVAAFSLCAVYFGIIRKIIVSEYEHYI